LVKAQEKMKTDSSDTQRGRRILQNSIFGLFRLSSAINGLALASVVYFLVVRGWRAVTWTFLTQPPMESMTKGGILPCIVGTICLSLGAILVAFPIGVASAIYLNEYARPGRVIRVIRLGINNLAGVPSIVFGLFGLAFFVVWMKMGVSILAGSLTLGVMTLPIIIGASEEALRAVPDTYREASLGLGATKWQTIYRVVLPAALPEIMALPYHIYVLATAGTEIETTRPLQYGTALVLIILVLGLNLVAIIYRSRLRRRMG
jgi:phosphate transport system permease protein